MAKNTGKTSATITMNAVVLDRLKKQAKAEKRTLSQQIEMLVEKNLPPEEQHQKSGRRQRVAA